MVFQNGGSKQNHSLTRIGGKQEYLKEMWKSKTLDNRTVCLKERLVRTRSTLFPIAHVPGYDSKTETRK